MFSLSIKILTRTTFKISSDSSADTKNIALSDDETRATSKASRGVLEHFHVFPKLPPELRLKIWKLALPGPRVIKLWKQRLTGSSIGQSEEFVKAAYIIPRLLHASHEARSVGLLAYNLIYEKRQELKPFYFDVKHDTLFAVNVDTLELIMRGPALQVDGSSRHTQDLVQHLMIGGELGNLKGAAMQLLSQYKTLKSLRLQTQRAFWETGPSADLGNMWKNKIVRRLRVYSKGVLIKWVNFGEMNQEFAESKVSLPNVWHCPTNNN